MLLTVSLFLNGLLIGVVGTVLVCIGNKTVRNMFQASIEILNRKK